MSEGQSISMASMLTTQEPRHDHHYPWDDSNRGTGYDYHIIPLKNHHGFKCLIFLQNNYHYDDMM